MKKSTKWIAALTAVIAIFFSLNSNAQSMSGQSTDQSNGYATYYGEVRLGVGAEVGVPTYKARSLSGFEAGGTLRLQVGVSNNLALIATSGFYNFFDKKSLSTGVGLGVVPAKLGIKGFLGKGIYFTGEGGQGYETSRDDATGQKDNKTILAGGLGWANKSLDIGVRYESFMGQNFDYGMIGLRIAYGFKL
jgi:hypothetical protein